MTFLKQGSSISANEICKGEGITCDGTQMAERRQKAREAENMPRLTEVNWRSNPAIDDKKNKISPVGRGQF